MTGVFTITKEVMSVILGVMEHVTSADKAYHYLREQGYDWTRAFVREAWKETGLKDAWSTVSKTYGTDRPIPRAWIIDKTGGLEPGYQLTVKVTYFDQNTGKVDTRYVSQIYDTVVPYDVAFSDLEDYLEEYEAVFGQSPISVAPGGIFRLTPK